MAQITQVAKTHEILDGQVLDESDHQALMNAAGIKIIEISLLDWSAYNSETDESALHATSVLTNTGDPLRENVA